jgi:hypothetical protein
MHDSGKIAVQPLNEIEKLLLALLSQTQKGRIRIPVEGLESFSLSLLYDSFYSMSSKSCYGFGAFLAIPLACGKTVVSITCVGNCL